MELKGKKVNFLGDSITEGVAASTPANRYVNVFAERTGAICRNYGISGTRIARQRKPSENASFDLDYCKRVLEMDEDADIIVIFGGTNDYGHGDAPIGTMADRTPDTFYGALHTLYRSAIERYPAAKIVVLTPLHRLVEDDPYGDPRKETPSLVLKDYVNIIREVAEYYALPVLDLYATSGFQPNVPVLYERYTSDGLHPNDAGHALLADLLIKFLERM